MDLFEAWEELATRELDAMSGQDIRDLAESCLKETYDQDHEYFQRRWLVVVGTDYVEEE